MQNDFDYSKWVDFALNIRRLSREVDLDGDENILEGLSPNIIQRLLESPLTTFNEKQLQAYRSDASTIFAMCGRGFGKSFLGSHWVVDKARRFPGTQIALVSGTVKDIRDVMVEGPSGIIKLAPSDFQPVWKPSIRRVEFPNGSYAIGYSGEDPEDIRGLSGAFAWVDEYAKIRYANEVKQQLGMSIREKVDGGKSQVLITTTPKPTKAVTDLAHHSRTHLIKGTTYDNIHNLNERMKEEILELEGTRIGRQEIYAEILEDGGNVWEKEDIVLADNIPNRFDAITVGLDPSVSDEERDECGIVVVGKKDDKGYVLADLSGQYTTSEWPAIAVGAFKGSTRFIYRKLTKKSRKKPHIKKLLEKYEGKLRPATRIHAERNQGGGVIEQYLKTVDANIAYRSTHTSTSKEKRAEPVHYLYEKGKVKHALEFQKLEHQMINFRTDMKDSPDRVDALVYAIKDLLLDENKNDALRKAFSRNMRWGG